MTPELSSKFEVVRGRWIHINDIADNGANAVTLNDGTVYPR